MKRGFSTKREAQEWENNFLLTKASSIDMTFEDFFEVYKADVKPKLKENTWASKEYIVRDKLLPYFGKVKMIDVQARDIIKWQNMMRSLKDSAGNPYAVTYLKTIQSQLSCIFNHAVRFYDLPANPVRKAESQVEEMLFWTKEEYLQFIPTMANKPYSYMAFEMLYWCGIRLGELRALTPSDFDFENKTVSITKSYQKIKGRDVITKPKTKKSIRVVIMPEMVAQEMEDFINSLYGIEPDTRIFNISKSYLHHEMDRGVKESGVKRIRIHDLRHSDIVNIKYLGFGFYFDSRAHQYKAKPHTKSVAKFKKRMKELTCRSWGVSNSHKVEKLNQLIRGWVNYFKIGSMRTLCKELDSRIRFRLRMCIWKQWKTLQNRAKNLMKLGISKKFAWSTAYYGAHIARVCQGGAMNMAVTKGRLTQFGVVSMLDYYTERCVVC